MAAAKGVTGFFVNLLGKRLCILGQAQSGKSQFWKSLLREAKQQETIDIEAVHRGTSYEDKEQCVIELNGKTIWLSRSGDVGGRDIFRKKWEELYKRSHIVLYLADGSKLFAKDKDHVDLVKSDLDDISAWKRKYKRKRKFIIIVTWCDILDLYRSKIPAPIDLDSERESFPPLDLKQFVRGANIIAGSALNDESCRATLTFAFKVIDL